MDEEVEAGVDPSERELERLEGGLQGLDLGDRVDQLVRAPCGPQGVDQAADLAADPGQLSRHPGDTRGVWSVCWVAGHG